MRFTYNFLTFGHQLLGQNWEVLRSWNGVCHRTLATQLSPDFAMIAFADRTWSYLTDVIWNNVPACRCADCVPLGSTLVEDQVVPVGQEQEIPWEHDDYYSRSEQLSDEANADYWDEVTRTRSDWHKIASDQEAGNFIDEDLGKPEQFMYDSPELADLWFEG